MAESPVFTDPQFLDASGAGGLNPAFTLVSGAIAHAVSGAFSTWGLLSPEAMTVSFTGLNASIGLPLPWGLVASGGSVVRAHGTVIGTDSTAYTVAAGGLVPATGTVEAYLVASVSGVYQNPIPLPGPPPGHPSWSPNYIPSYGYATLQDTVALAFTTTPPDNASAFELLRTLLTAGQSSITSWTTIGQQRAGGRKAWPAAAVSGGILLPQQLQTMLTPTSGGLTSTLPLSVLCGGLVGAFSNTSTGAWTLAASGTDTLVGFSGSTGTSLSIPANESVALWTDGDGYWRMFNNYYVPPLNGYSAQTALVSSVSAGGGYTRTLTFVPRCVGYLNVQSAINIAGLGTQPYGCQIVVQVNAVTVTSDETVMPMTNFGVAQITSGLVGTTVTIVSEYAAPATPGTYYGIDQILAINFIPGT